MYKIIGADGKEYGPISLEVLRQWIAEGAPAVLSAGQRSPSGAASVTTILAADLHALSPKQRRFTRYFTAGHLRDAKETETCELALGEAKWTATITEAFDPRLRGPEHDRVKRRESYVKDFKPLSLGVVELKPGKGTLTLRATKVARRRMVADVRAVELVLTK